MVAQGPVQWMSVGWRPSFSHDISTHKVTNGDRILLQPSDTIHRYRVTLTWEALNLTRYLLPRILRLDWDKLLRLLSDWVCSNALFRFRKIIIHCRSLCFAGNSIRRMPMGLTQKFLSVTTSVFSCLFENPNKQGWRLFYTPSIWQLLYAELQKRKSVRFSFAARSADLKFGKDESDSIDDPFKITNAIYQYNTVLYNGIQLIYSMAWAPNNNPGFLISEIGDAEQPLVPTKSRHTGGWSAARWERQESSRIITAVGRAKTKVYFLSPFQKKRQGVTERFPKVPLLHDFNLIGSGYDEKNPWQISARCWFQNGRGKSAVGGAHKISIVIFPGCCF